MNICESGNVLERILVQYVPTDAIYHDEEAFDEPEAFKPGRYLLTPHGTKPGYDDSAFRSTLMFGGGRVSDSL